MATGIKASAKLVSGIVCIEDCKSYFQLFKRLGSVAAFPWQVNQKIVIVFFPAMGES